MDNRNRDRGNIKWTAMMLTEHVKLLRDWYDEDKQVAEPMYDEYEFEELMYQIQLAIQTRSIVSIDFWRNKKKESVEGTVKNTPVRDSYITILSSKGDFKVYIPHILKINVYDV